MTSRPRLAVETRGPVVVLTLDQPERRNALDESSSDEIRKALDAAAENDEIATIVITGRGTAFCSGGDLRRIMSPDPLPVEWVYRMVRDYNRLIGHIRDLDRIVIAAVNGPAIGGGAALALACDLAIASPDARYDFSFGRIGLSSADMGTTYMLSKAVGPYRATQILLTGASLNAAQLVQLGLVTEVVASDVLLDRAVQLGEQIAAGPRWANVSTKMALQRSQSTELSTTLEYEAFLQTSMMASSDHKQRLKNLLLRPAARSDIPEGSQ